jgi:hypothetical protein
MVDSLNAIPKKPGVYVFARRHGDSVAPLYIGQALRLRSRIEGQFNSVKLMNGVKSAPSGKRILIVGALKLRRGQRKAKVLDAVESALIKRALAEGYRLLNQQGTKTKTHEIRSRGNSISRKLVPLTMYVAQ